MLWGRCVDVVADTIHGGLSVKDSAGAGAVPPLPGAQGQVPQAQVQGSQGQGSERLTMDTKWIPAAPMPVGRAGILAQRSCRGSRVGWKVCIFFFPRVWP